MKKIFVKTLINCLIAFGCAISTYLLFFNIYMVIIVLGGGTFIACFEMGITILNKLIIHTNWYQNQFIDAPKFLKIPQQLDLINLGSNPARFALDYSEFNIKAANLAVSPQTLYYDYQVLKNYHSFLKPNGVVIFLFCPYSFLKDFYCEKDGLVYKDIRYYPFLHRAMIRNYDTTIFKKWVKYPVFLGWHAWIRIIKDCQKNNNLDIDYCRFTSKQMEEDAINWDNNWKKEFGVSNLSEELPDGLKKVLVFTKEIFSKMVLFTKERKYQPVIVVPPISIYLRKKFPKSFLQKCFYNEFNDQEILVLDYMEDEQFSKDSYFFDSFFLNKAGRKIFTQRVIEDLKLNGYLI